MYTKEQVREHIEALIDPSVEKTFKETNGIKHLDIDEEKGIVTLILGLEKLEDDYKKYLTHVTLLLNKRFAAWMASESTMVSCTEPKELIPEAA